MEQRWQQAAAALGPAERQVKFLRLLGAKGAAAGAAAAGGGDGAVSAERVSENVGQEGGNPNAASGAHKVRTV